MANEYQNTSNIDTLASTKAGLVTDLNSSYIGKDQYGYARNATRNSKNGDLGTIGNEPSTISCFTAPYQIIGTINLNDDTVLVFSGDGKNSEIGLGDLRNCSYKTLKNDACFGFDPNFPITGVAKNDFQKGIIATFTDRNKPVRRVEVNKLPALQSCDDILLFKKITQPCITVKKGQVGNMPNGVYSVAIAYVIDGQVFSDWYSITNRTMLFSETGSNSLEITLEGLDTEFEQFAVAVVGNYIDPTTKGATKLAKQVGIYSTKVKNISVTDFINPNYLDIQLSQLLIKKSAWTTAGIISSNSQYLILGDLVGRAEEDYQLKAMGIESEYVIEQVEADYYETDGEDISYYGDENYDFYIEGITNTGESTDKYHIPGPKATPYDRAVVASADVYEHDEDYKDCEPRDKVERWRVENTAGKLNMQNNKFVCGRRILGSGKLGYFESKDLYPDNPKMFGEWSNTPIRYHKFPDEAKVPRYSVINGKTYINIKGIRFKKIPKFNNPDIIGYRITRSDRKGGNGTVVARGLMTNIRSYKDDRTDKEIMFSNYTVNDLNPDVYLSSKQTSFRRQKEENFEPLVGHYNDRFNFYSPHTLFEPRYKLGSEIKIECEEVATVRGNFEIVHNHPKAKLMNQFAFWVSAAVGFIQSALIIMGRNDARIGAQFHATVTGGYVYTFEKDFKMSNWEDLVTLNVPQYIAGAIAAGKFDEVGSAIKAIFTVIASVGLKIPISLLEGMIEADKLIGIIHDLTGYTDYVYQYNAHALFNLSIPVFAGNKRRRLIAEASYIPSDNVTIGDKTYINYFREKSVYLELNKEIAEPTTKDTSRNTISGFGICDDPTQTVTSTGSAFYATSKVLNPNQYGRLGSSAPVSIHSCVLPFSEGDFTSTPVLYGGDCIITRFSFQKKMQFFRQNMANANFPNDTEYDYRMYRNIAYPRFWIDTSKYDFSQLIGPNVINFSRFSRTTTSKHNLDCKKRNDGGSIARIDDAYMYLSNNCVMDFMVECDYNIAYREMTERPHFSKKNSDLSEIFRSDRLKEPEEFNINRVYSDIYTTEIFNVQQREDFDPDNPIPVEQPNSVIYSLPSYNLQNVDNWRYFLPANYFSFRESDFGKLTAIHKLDQDRIIFLFSKSSPYISMGRDILELEGSGRKVTLGDGGLFAQDPREVMPTDNNYGACNSKYAFSNTHLGRYYPSERQGRILQFTEGLDDITRQGMSYWCKNYMPIQLYQTFPDYPQVENPINGVGYLSAFDSFNETIYITKRDFSPRNADIHWDKTAKSFMYQGNKVQLRDERYFDDISWTLSYAPIEKAFISYHDWHPDWIIQTDNHFMSVKNNGVWKHNESFESFCEFYGKKHPFEIGFLSSSGQTIETVRSLEYLLEVYKYKNRGRDMFHVHHENFDKLIVKNTEQISPVLNMVYANPDPEMNLEFPKRSSKNNKEFDIAFFKEENKYRVNQFWDATKDRGEFTNAEFHLFPTDGSGYRSVVNPVAIDMNKPEEERKKFRHYWNEFRLSKSESNDNKFIVKLLNVKKQLSIR